MNQPSPPINQADQVPLPVDEPKPVEAGYSIIPDWLLSRPDLSPGAKLCWARLTRYAHRDGTAWPSLQRIAGDLAVCRDQARRYVHELVRCKLVKIESKGRAGLTPRYLPFSPGADMPPVALMSPVADMQGEGLHICHGGECINATLIDNRINKEEKNTVVATATVPPVIPVSDISSPPFKLQSEPEPKKRTVFKAPTVEDVSGYCQKRGNAIIPQEFVDHYTASGWRLKGGQKMADWQASIRTWENHEKRRSNQAMTAKAGVFK